MDKYELYPNIGKLRWYLSLNDRDLKYLHLNSPKIIVIIGVLDLDGMDCSVPLGTTLPCTALLCIALHCTALHSTTLHCMALEYTAPRFTAPY